MSLWKKALCDYREGLHDYPEKTRTRRLSQLGHFATWCSGRGWEPSDLSLNELESYQAHLVESGGISGRPLDPSTIKDYLVTLTGFFGWLVRQRRLLTNPAKDLVLPKNRHRIPRTLTVAQIERVMRQPDLETPAGLRDRAILETLYATGIRASELAKLTVQDLDPSRGLVWIRQGKGRKDRLVPMTERAERWVEHYLVDVRAAWITGPDEGRLFIRPPSRPLKNTYLAKRVKTYLRKAGIDIDGACHLFRHSVATLMMENGADLSVIAEMLGHSSLESTQIYTHVSLKQLRAIQKQTEPKE